MGDLLFTSLSSICIKCRGPISGLSGISAKVRLLDYTKVEI